ncbi:MAG: hypothetical protein M0R51_05255 [Clostridia bacterium]|jgi:hypothetical protein|nr:hypothetical protein [Clostridia bacterium]
MDIKEVNERYASFKRTEKAINDGKAKIREQEQMLDDAFVEFADKATEEGFLYTAHGFMRAKSKSGRKK